MACIVYLYEHMLHYLIECFDYPISLWMIGISLLVLNLELLCQCTKSEIDEVTSLIAHQDIRTTNQVMTLLNRNLATVVAVQSSTIVAFAHLFK